MMSFSEYRSILFKSFCKYYSFGNEVKTWDKKKRWNTLLWVTLWNLITGLLIVLLLYVLGKIFNFNINVFSALFGCGVGVCIGIANGVYDFVIPPIIEDVAESVVFGVVGVIVFSVIFGVILDYPADKEVKEMIFGTAGAVALVLVVAVRVSMIFGMTIGMIFSMIFSMIFGGIFGLYSIPISILIGCVFSMSTYLLVAGRFWYFLQWPLYRPGNPLWWDENIGIAVPNLPNILKEYARSKDIEKTFEFAVFLIEERPVQRKSAQKGLMLIVLDRLKNLRDLQDLQDIHQVDFLPTQNLLDDRDRPIPTVFGISLGVKSKHLNFNQELQKFLPLATDLSRAATDQNYANRIRVYEQTRDKLAQLRKEYLFSTNPLAKEWTEVTIAWHGVLNRTIEDLRNSGKLPLPNPYIMGKPAAENAEIFVGRRDIIEKIQTETLRDGDATTILFIGNRRTGKSSTLLNLQPHVQSDLRTVYCDMQNAEFNSDAETFCETLSGRIQTALGIKTDERIQNFAALTRFLQTVDQQLTAENRHLLICIDEYERIQQYVDNGRLSSLPDSLRHWIQHLRRVVFLLAGSHEPSEIKGLDWTDYLINVRLVPISYLEKEAAMQLVTHPVSYFDLTWSPEELPEQMIERLGSQPFLLQCAMWNLVEMLNRAGRKNATTEDVDKAIHKILEQDAKTHFDHFWNTEMTEESRAMLLALAQGVQPKTGVLLNWLKRREILKEGAGKVVFCVPVLSEWILMNAE